MWRLVVPEAWPAAPRLGRAPLSAVLAALALLRPGAPAPRPAPASRLQQGIAAGLAAGSAQETSWVDEGTFPAAAPAPVLPRELAGFLPPGGLAALPGAPVGYAPAPDGYRRTPAGGGVKVALTVQARRGGSLAAGGRAVPIWW